MRRTGEGKARITRRKERVRELNRIGRGRKIGVGGTGNEGVLKEKGEMGRK